MASNESKKSITHCVADNQLETLLRSETSLDRIVLILNERGLRFVAELRQIIEF